MRELIDRQAFRAAHGLGSDCHDCKRDMKSCQYDRDYSLMDFCEWLDDAPTASPWHRVENGLPEESKEYIVHLQMGTGVEAPDCLGKVDLSYVTSMYFKKEKGIWFDEYDESYNGDLSLVDTVNDYHVTHWMPFPEPPQEE